VVVDKPNGDIRCCGNYPALNKITVPDRYPLPNIADFSARLAHTSVYSKVDLVRGYHQIPMAEEDVHKTAVVTPVGLFEYLRMPFGLANAAQTFQRLMDVVCQGLDFVFVYLDDILIASKSRKEHLEHLKQLFQRLSDHGLVIAPNKCEFGRSELSFLGHTVSAKGAKPLPARVKAISQYPRPRTVKELQRFLGALNFYHRFIPHAADILRPLYMTTAGKVKPNDLVEWTDCKIEAFERARQTLAESTLLAHPDPQAMLAITTDASNTAVGAVLEQRLRGSKVWQPLGFFSKNLRPPALKYSAYDRELLAVKLAIRHFRCQVEGRWFTVFTDHLPLTFALSRRSPTWTARQQRTVGEISEYTADIRHISGRANVVADALSRAPVVSAFGRREAVDFDELSVMQESDPDLAAVKTSITGLQWVDVPIGPEMVGVTTRACGVKEQPTLLCDISTGRLRPYVPLPARRKVFESIHALSHPSVRSTVAQVKARYVWHGMARDITNWARSCQSCQRAKVQTHVKAAPEKFDPPTGRFRHLHIDLVGPLPPSGGFSHILTVVDRFTRFPEAYPPANTDTSSVARAFTMWVARYGMPSHIISDRGVQFTSSLWAALSQLYGAKLHRTTAYHPQANGLVERSHRTLKASLKAALDSAGNSWLHHLPWVLLGLRTMPREDLGGISTAELVYGEPIAVPGDFLPEQKKQVSQEECLQRLREKVGKLAPVPTSQHGAQKERVPVSLSRAKFVFVRRGPRTGPLDTPYTGPYKVVRQSNKYFVLDVGGRHEAISVDRLKAAHTESDQEVTVAVPPRRGRPPKN